MYLSAFVLSAFVGKKTFLNFVLIYSITITFSTLVKPKIWQIHDLTNLIILFFIHFFLGSIVWCRRTFLFSPGLGASLLMFFFVISSATDLRLFSIDLSYFSIVLSILMTLYHSISNCKWIVLDNLFLGTNFFVVKLFIMWNVFIFVISSFVFSLNSLIYLDFKIVHEVFHLSDIS